MTTCADVKYKSGFESSAVCLVYVDITIKIMVRIPAWCRSHQEGKDIIVRSLPSNRLTGVEPLFSLAPNKQ